MVGLVLSHRFAKFCVVGALGFLTDAAVLQGSIYALSLDPISARVLSFIVAATVTWWFNRRFTFVQIAAPRRYREWTRYVTVNSVGAAINFAVYTTCVLTVEAMAALPVIALAIASGVALIFNYYASRHLVFRASA